MFTDRHVERAEAAVVAGVEIETGVQKVRQDDLVSQPVQHVQQGAAVSVPQTGPTPASSSDVRPAVSPWRTRSSRSPPQHTQLAR